MILEFLKLLYSKNNNKEIKYITNKIFKIKINFIYFILANKYLCFYIFSALLYDLLDQSKVLQIYKNKVTYNQFILIYFDNKQEFSNCCIIMSFLSEI